MQMRHARIKVIAAVITLFGMVATPITAEALAVPAKPTDIPVVDQTNTLTAEQKAAIATKIAEERKATGNQIAVLMVSSLDGDALENYSLNVAREWGIGQDERDSGVLLLVVKDDRRLRIEVGYGLEGALPD
ncbi:MAG: TPM domain-containing protein, partial [Candidatus Saccharimonadales bacterium]